MPPAVIPVRFIPAGAGNTTNLTTRDRRTAVHPRGRGEHTSSSWAQALDPGSSPRARGTPGPGAAGLCRGRFIPAGAGNTTSAPPKNRAPAVHPRGRGEHAGAWAAARCGSAVHPRGRGEHAGGIVADGFGAGSSPRARGTLCPIAPHRCEGRFIPAGAGNTAQAAKNAASNAVHPRGRGEHGYLARQKQVRGGSSPRARGTPDGLRVPGARSRFIPAGAGNTTTARARTGTTAVHPRGRGEHLLRSRGGWRERGSSPRARGTRACRSLSDVRNRFIPAGAGNTSPLCPLT